MIRTILLISLLIPVVNLLADSLHAEVSGELRQWHKVTLSLPGPEAEETDTDINPFLNYRMTVTFTHESGSPRYTVPGYFAADGDAGETSATKGNIWRAHLSPDKAGEWNYEVSFVEGKHVAIDPAKEGKVVAGIDKQKGQFHVRQSNKSGRDFRSKGRLQYVGERYLRFAGSGEYFLKAGADSPENLLAYADFDGTYSAKPGSQPKKGEAAPPPALKTWTPHLRDWHPGDPTWKHGKGKGLIGALNYLAGKGMNSVSFLTYNAGGDGDDVWPFISRNEKFHYDCSKLDQWQLVFDYAQSLGLYLHFKLQETELDDNRHRNEIKEIPTSLDGGKTGIERKLYLRELIARFGYQLALNWNLGEENTQSPEEQRAMAQYIHDTDAFNHHIVVHTYPNKQDEIYPHLLGKLSKLTGASLQNSWENAHQRVLKWVQASTEAGKPWVVAHDEQNPHYTGVPPDVGFEGFEGMAVPEDGRTPYTIHDVRKYDLWGVFTAGGAGVEYYFGYTLPQTDLGSENWRSRDQSWDYARIALEFFNQNQIPVWEMEPSDSLVGNDKNENSNFCLAKAGECYLVYLTKGGTIQLDLRGQPGTYAVHWYDPRTGGELQTGTQDTILGGQAVSLGYAPTMTNHDWAVLIRKQ